MERTHIAFFGRRNAGKSSLVNRFTSQAMSIVSDVPGTTTDPVRKTMELLPLGPVVVIDTPGIDDEGQLGAKRIERSLRVIDETDIAVLVIDGTVGIGEDEKILLEEFKKRRIPSVTVISKSDLDSFKMPEELIDTITVSSFDGTGIEELKNKIASIIKQREVRPLVSDLVEKGDIVVLVVPIDKSAPKDRLILPQQMVIRDLLGAGAIPVVVKDTELDIALSKVGKVKMVITDSQVFGRVARIVPADVPLTSFSILMARFKGILDQSVDGAQMLDKLGAGFEGLTGFGIHNQIHITLTVPGLPVSQAVELFGQGLERLAQQHDLLGMDGDLAGLGLEHISLNTHDVTDIELFEILILFLAYEITGNIALDRALQILHVAEGSLAHNALGHKPSGDGDGLALQLGKAVLYFGAVVGNVITGYDKGVLPGRLELCQLIAADLQYFRKLLHGSVGLCITFIAHICYPILNCFLRK